MPLRRKLLFYLTIPALFLGVIGYVSMASLLRLERAADDILSDNYQTIQEARAMEVALRIMEFGDPDSARGAERAAAAFEKSLSVCERNITEHGEQEVLRAIRALWDDYLLRFQRDPRAQEPDLPVLYERLDALIDLNEKAMFAYERRTRRVARFTMVLTGTAMGITASALFLFAVVAAGRISRPILSVANDLHQALNPESGHSADAGAAVDEISRLESEVHGLLERLNRYEDEQTRKLTRLQARLAFVIEEVSEGLVLLDGSLAVLGSNRVGRGILNSESGAPRLDGELRAALEAATRQDASPADSALPEVRVAHGDQDLVYAPRLLPFTDDDGRVEGFLLVFWNVTEERRFEEARRRFISMLSHQLKTPMTSLSMSVNLLHEKLRGRSEDTDDLLQMARADCGALSNLITELIGASKGVIPGLALNPVKTDLPRLLDNALKPLAAQARSQDIALEQDMGAAPVFATVDLVKFPWVVTNIVGNALRYTAAGGAVRVALAAAGEYVEITISDTGVGINQEDLDRLFLPYTSLEDRQDPGAMGLGLTIVKEIVEAHQGRIAVRSTVGQGTAFTITIPR